MWAVGTKPGMARKMGSTAGEVVDRIRINGDSSDFHIAIVPPFAALLSRGRSGQNESSLLRLNENLPENIENMFDRLQW